MITNRLSRRIQAAIIFGAGLALVAGGVTLAARHLATRPPTTSAQTATFSLSAHRSTQIHCTGTDGSYLHSSIVYLGTMSGAADRRLNGNIRVVLNSLVNTTSGDGESTGYIRWLTAKGKDTGNHGTVEAVDIGTGNLVTESQTLHGVIDASLAPSPGSKKVARLPSGDLMANFVAQPGSSAGSWTGQLGGTSLDDRRPAVVQSGHC